MKNGRKSFRKIAKEIGVTPDTVARRYRKLKRNGTIKVRIQIKPAEIGYCALLECDLAFKSQRDSLKAIDILAKLQDVFCMVLMSGDYDMRVWILIRDIKHLLTVQDKILELPSVSRMKINVSRLFLDLFPAPNQYFSTM